jgi:hypothetical protein
MQSAVLIASDLWKPPDTFIVVFEAFANPPYTPFPKLRRVKILDNTILLDTVYNPFETVIVSPPEDLATALVIVKSDDDQLSPSLLSRPKVETKYSAE